MRNELRIGGVILDRSLAQDAARKYLSGSGGYSYPGYDAFDGGAGPWRLADGDLLAPALLNAGVRVPGFYALADARPKLEAWLSEVPTDLRLHEAGDRELAQLGELFALVDDGLPHVGGVTLSKVMHRKRPAFIPLYDPNIWHCYAGSDDAPVPRAKQRTWQQFIILLAGTMIDDLHREHDWLTKIAAFAAGPVPVTNLRALDIVAWQAGKAAGLHDLADHDDGPD